MMDGPACSMAGDYPRRGPGAQERFGSALEPGKQRGRRREMTCRASVTLSDHVDGLGQAPSRVRIDKMCARCKYPSWTRNSATAATHNDQGRLSASLSVGHGGEEARIAERVHRIDRRRNSSTISVMNRQGRRCDWRPSAEGSAGTSVSLGQRTRWFRKHRRDSSGGRFRSRGKWRGASWWTSSAPPRTRGTRRTSTMRAT
jgi:hypothetical protein